MHEPSSSKEGSAVAITAEGQGAPIPFRQPSWRLLFYGAFNFPLSLSEIPILVYLPAFYAQELHLEAGLVGLVFLLARIWDSLFDLIVAWLSDRSTSRFGRRKPWVIAAAPLLIISTWYVCMPPKGAGLGYLGIWAALFFTAFTGAKIPHLSWGTELATGYSERSRVSAFRESFMMVGNLFFAAAPLLLLPDGAPLHDVLFLISITVLITVPLSTIPLALFVPDPTPTVQVRTHLLEGITALSKDPILVRFGAGMFLKYLSDGVMNSLAVFSLTVGLGLPDKLFLIILVIYISTLAVLPLTMRLAKYFEKHHLFMGANILTAILMACFFLVPPNSLNIVLFIWFLTGILSSAILILPASMLADIVDHGDITTGVRRSGSYVAIYNLVQKIGLAVGVGLSFALLEVVGFRPGVAHHGATDVFNIRMVGFGLPILLLVMAIVCFMKYPITRAVHHRLRAQIEARNKAAPPLADDPYFPDEGMAPQPA